MRVIIYPLYQHCIRSPVSTPFLTLCFVKNVIFPNIISEIVSSYFALHFLSFVWQNIFCMLIVIGIFCVNNLFKGFVHVSIWLIMYFFICRTLYIAQQLLILLFTYGNYFIPVLYFSFNYAHLFPQIICLNVFGVKSGNYFLYGTWVSGLSEI